MREVASSTNIYSNWNYNNTVNTRVDDDDDNKETSKTKKNKCSCAESSKSINERILINKISISNNFIADIKAKKVENQMVGSLLNLLV